MHASPKKKLNQNKAVETEDGNNFVLASLTMIFGAHLQLIEMIIYFLIR